MSSIPRLRRAMYVDYADKRYLFIESKWKRYRPLILAAIAIALVIWNMPAFGEVIWGKRGDGSTFTCSSNKEVVRFCVVLTTERG